MLYKVARMKYGKSMKVNKGNHGIEELVENGTQAGMKMSCRMVLLRANLVLFRTTNSEEVISQQFNGYFHSY